MFEKLKSEWQRESTKGRTRLHLYVSLFLLLFAAIMSAYSCTGGEGLEPTPLGPDVRPQDAPPPASVDLSQLPQNDDDGVHAAYDRRGVEHLVEVSELLPLTGARTVDIEALNGLPVAEARGRLFVVQGRVSAIVRQAWPDENHRLWSIVLEDEKGRQAIILRSSLASDLAEGRPYDALQTTVYIAEGDELLARGVYLQRRTGSLERTILREPVPVLVATPPRAAFRKILPPAAPIESLSEADWDQVKDRYLGQTQNLDEPAIFQVLQWAQRKGHAAILEDIRSGKFPAEHWDQDTFVNLWEHDVAVESDDASRTFTEGARGRLFYTTGLLGSYVESGWTEVQRQASRWGINEIRLIDLLSDHYGNAAIRMYLAFPLESFEGVEAVRAARLRVYGVFCKNWTYRSRRPAPEGEDVDLVTVPFFVALHVEADEAGEKPYRGIIWVISGLIVLLAVLFYVVLVRGERREVARTEAHRLELRRRARRAAGRSGGSVGEREPDDGSEDEPLDEEGA